MQPQLVTRPGANLLLPSQLLSQEPYLPTCYHRSLLGTWLMFDTIWKSWSLVVPFISRSLQTSVHLLWNYPEYPTTTLNQWRPTSSVKSLILKSTIEEIISAIPGWSSKSCNHDINPWSQVPLTDISFLCCKSPWALARHAELHCLVLNKSNSHGSIGPHSWPFQ